MNKANYLISRTFKGAMAFVLAVGLCPVAPAMAQEGATANEEGGAAAAVVDGAGASTDGAVAGATGGVAGSEADGVQPGGVSGDAAAAANGAGVGASAQDAAENDATDSGVSTDVVEAAAAVDEGADESNDADAQTDGWQVWGGCEWMIDAEGCLTIRPKDGAEVGWLPDLDWSGPWRADAYAQSIESVKVEKRVEASSGVEGLFGGLSSAASMDLSGLDVSSVTNMYGMFHGCSSLASLDLSGWDTSNVTDMSWMFYGCSSLREVSLGPATRVELPAPSGGDVSGRWVSSADGVAYRLSDVPAGVAATYTAQLAESEASGLNSLGSCVWTIGEGGALTISPLPGCASGELCGLEGSGSPFSRYGAEVASVRIAPGVKASGSLSGLFSGLSSAASMDLSGLDVSSVTDMSSMFSGCSSLRKISLGEATRVDLPTPSGDGLTGRWVSSADGVAYRPSDIPLGVAATYAAQRSDSAAGVANSAGSCTWKIDADGVLVIAPLPNSSSGMLDCGRADPGDSLYEVPWSQTSRDILSVHVEPGVKISGSASRMFANLPFAESMDLSGLDTSAVTNMSSMFSGCTSLQTADLSSFDTSMVRHMSSMFSGCSSLTELDLSSFDTRSLVDEGEYSPSMSYMFSGCASLETVDLSSFDTSSVTNMSGIFSGCSSLGSLDLSDWNTLRVVSMSGMFSNCSSLASLDVSSWDTSSVANMSAMFSGCTLLQAVDLSSIDTSSVTNMSSLFEGCESLRALDLSSFDTSKVEDMSQMFKDCSSLASLDLSSFDTSSVAGSGGTYSYDGMCGMFQGCSSLTKLDLSSFNTSKVRNMLYMFWNCERLKSVNLSSFDTKNVACFESMFSGCSALESLDLSNFNTSHAVGSALSRMFQGCSSLKSLDVSSFDTSRITDFSSMFSGCDSLKSLDLSSFDTTRATKMDYMFDSSGGTLSRVTLGDKFSFSKNGKRLCSLPSDWSNVGWYDESAGKAYSVDEIPDNVATTYVKQKRLERDQFTVDDTRSVYTGAPIKKPIKSDLVEGVDYVVSYENNIGPGGANIYIRGINRWYGELSYHFYIDGSAQRGQWMHDSNGWWYVDASGSYPSNEWRAIDGSYYYFNGSGYMCTNWLNYGGAWYWLGGSGAMATGWRSIGGSWYWFDDSGAMASGWKQIDGTYYYFNGSGAMQTGWLNTGGAWYYLSGSGAMATGWLSLGGTWYWFDASGAMATGWKWIGGSCYYFDGSGAMQASKWIDGSYVDSDGRWDQSA